MLTLNQLVRITICIGLLLSLSACEIFTKTDKSPPENSIPFVSMFNAVETTESGNGPFDAPVTGVPSGYRGFEGSYDYPKTPVKPKVYPWTRSLNGKPITTKTAEEYMTIVKNYITEDMVVLLGDNRKVGGKVKWNAGARGWYNEPWMSTIRDGVHGGYLGSSCFSPILFPKSGLKEPFSTYVLVFYNDIAARSLHKVWGKTAMSPTLDNNAAIYDEGSIIVKAAFTTATEQTWEPMANALPWDIYLLEIDCATGKQAKSPSLIPTRLFQFDIVVKDSKAAPKTQWVFSTVVHDPSQAQMKPNAATAWKNMNFLGVMWGNDPQATKPGETLRENWINPTAPIYSKETLGWGGRLSGPNDGSVQNPPYYICKGAGCNVSNPCTGDTCEFVDTGGKNIAMSSCMSCHSSAQYGMASFLLPVPSGDPTSTGAPTMALKNNSLVFYEPASTEWMTWFQDRSGTEPKDPTNKKVMSATDYNMNFPFKSIPYWAQEVCIHQGNPNNNKICTTLN